ncbi:MAG: competence/damage-inducible protein A [Actinomycetota bacterium]
MKRVEIFSIGDELLRGVVADTNSHWMAQRIAARGASLTRVTTLPDEIATVSSALREASVRSPAMIFTQGGLGPTDDDRTREAVATAFDLPLVHDQAAEDIVNRRYQSLYESGRIADASMSEARYRMCTVPRGAIALDNQIGGAPGLLLRIGPLAIVSLPGVPSELHWIWEHSLAPHLDEILGPGGFAEITVTLTEHDESRLAPALRAIAERHARVYVKSRATAFDQPDPRVRLTLTAAAGSDEEARLLVDACLTDALEALAPLGVELDSTIGRSATT